MELQGGGGSAALPGGGGGVSGGVPAFLSKLWTLVADPDTDSLIRWSPSGSSFHVLDQGLFSKEVLPKFFKHNNMASFIRQLNMYGFRKVVHIQHGGLLKPEQDDTEFQHPYFLRGQEVLLENIKRKVTTGPGRQEEVKMLPDEVSKILSDVQVIRGKQENIDCKISAMKHENEVLWREIASLRQKHTQQQKVVSKLIQFLLSLVQSKTILGMKRKIPLMLNDSSSSHSLPKYGRQFSLEHLQTSPALSASSGPIISDITELVPPTELSADWIDTCDSPLVDVKEEPSSPGVEEEGPAVDTPLSPTTFINSILQENQPSPAPQAVQFNPVSMATNPVSMATAEPTSQSHSVTPPRPVPFRPDDKCLSLACIDKAELSGHLDDIDSGLENLQHFLQGQHLGLDSSPLFEFLSSSPLSADFDLDSLDTLLSEAPRETDSSAGKQLVQYSAMPLPVPEPISSDLPALLELGGVAYFPSDDPGDALLSRAEQELPDDRDTQTNKE